MLRQHAHFMVTLLVIADACAVAAGWVISYWLRFTWMPVDAAKGVPEFTGKYLTMLLLVVPAQLVIFQFLRLYQPRRDRGILNEARDIIKAFAVSIIAIIVIDYALPHSDKISRGFMLTYAVVGTACFALLRITVRAILHEARRRGWNRRTAAIVGTGRNAQELLFAIRRNGWTGIEVLYFVDDLSHEPGVLHRGLPVAGPFSRLPVIVQDRPVDIVFVALPVDEARRTEEVLGLLQTTTADIRLVPEINPAFLMRPNVSELEGLPILAMRSSPLYGWNAVLKRSFDVVVGGLCLLVAAVPMLVIAVLIRLTSPGPILYRQRRMGLDGREFTLLKFRTMRVDAEEQTGAVWATSNDPRRTPLGAFLRRTSLDELPNLLNVLAGQMSLVGPRPERPEFIEQFKHEIPRYMLRHKMKAGMTGLAQARGYRGNTSLKKRIQHDVHYINNWSLRLDIRILAQTVTEVWFSRHET